MAIADDRRSPPASEIDPGILPSLLEPTKLYVLWQLQQSHLQVELAYSSGDVAEEINNLAHAADADLIVMSTHGMPGLDRLYVGDVANQLIRILKTHVLLLRPTDSWQKLSVDLIAMLIMASLLIFGVVSPQEGISGFSHKATVTVAAIFIISAGLFKTGAVSYLGKVTVLVFKKNYWLGLISLMIAVGFFSAFINNTQVVTVFIPILLSVAKEIKTSASKLLMLSAIHSEP